MRSAASASGGRGFVVVLRGQELPLRPHARYLIGRHPACEIVLDDRMVSRRHARLLVHDSVVVEDLGSANGVFVDGIRVHGSQKLALRQRIQIGASELVLSQSSVERRARETTRGRGLLATVPERMPPVSESSGDSTDQRSYNEVLGGLADKLIARGQGEDAEALVGAHMINVLEQWRKDGAGDLELAERCAERALGLASVTQKSFWLEYVFELYSAIGSLLPEPLVDESYRVVHHVRRPSPDALGAYVERIGRAEHGPSERFRMRRLEGLRRMICAL